MFACEHVWVAVDRADHFARLCGFACDGVSLCICSMCTSKIFTYLHNNYWVNVSIWAHTGIWCSLEIEDNNMKHTYNMLEEMKVHQHCHQHKYNYSHQCRRRSYHHVMPISNHILVWPLKNRTTRTVGSLVVVSFVSVTVADAVADVLVRLCVWVWVVYMYVSLHYKLFQRIDYTIGTTNTTCFTCSPKSL